MLVLDLPGIAMPTHVKPNPGILDERGSDDQALHRNDEAHDEEDELAGRGAVEDDERCDEDELCSEGIGSNRTEAFQAGAELTKVQVAPAKPST